LLPLTLVAAATGCFTQRPSAPSERAVATVPVELITDPPAPARGASSGPSAAGPSSAAPPAAASSVGGTTGEPPAAHESTASSQAANAAGSPPPARHAFHQALPSASLPANAPASRAANLSPAQCRSELRKRKLPVKRAKRGAAGVANPLRLEAPLHGVRFALPRPPSPYGVMDCRMVLTLDEFARVLAGLDVTSVRVDNIYRPRAKLPGRRKKSQHAYGLALDIVHFRLKDGRTLSINGNWHAPIGSAVCGPEAVMDPQTDDAVALRNIVCAVAREAVFHHLLTPSFNAAHRDHIHADIKRDKKRRSVR
jgi:hypothetical protein